MNIFIERFIFRQNEEQDQRHVDVVRSAVGCIVQCLQYRDHQLLDIFLGHHKLVESFITMQQQVQQENRLVNINNFAQCVVQRGEINLETLHVLLNLLRGIRTAEQTRSVWIFSCCIVIR